MSSVPKVINGSRPGGYTIVEVMIVLAVSGVMFLLAATFVNGKQQSTAFYEGANEMASRLQDVIDQVSDGQYSDVPFSCTTPTGVGPLTFDSATNNNTIGSGASISTLAGNSNCTYVGKFLQFNLGGSDTAYDTFTLAAARVDSSGTAIYDLSNADVTPVYDFTSPSSFDLTVKDQEIAQSLNVKSITITAVGGSTPTATYGSGANGSNYGIGIIQSFGATDGGGGYANGSQSNNLVYAQIIPASADEAQAVSSLRPSAALQPLDPATQAVLCLTDGTRYANITIDAQHATAQLLGETPC